MWFLSQSLKSAIVAQEQPVGTKVQQCLQNHMIDWIQPVSQFAAISGEDTVVPYKASILKARYLELGSSKYVFPPSSLANK